MFSRYFDGFASTIVCLQAVVTYKVPKSCRHNFLTLVSSFKVNIMVIFNLFISDFKCT